MRMEHTTRILRLRGLWIPTSAALVSTVLACSGDDNSNNNSGDAACATSTSTVVVTHTATATGSTSGSTSTSTGTSVADAAHDAPATDSAADSSVDATTDATTDATADAAADAAADVTSGPPAPLNLCAQLDALFNVDATTRQEAWGWPSVIALGPPANLADSAANPNTYVGYGGFQGLVFVDCDIAGFYNAAGANTGGWANNIRNWEERIFGCPAIPDAGADAGLSAGIGFGLVPSEAYGATQLRTTADLKRLGDTFVEAVVQAVTNQATDPSNPNVPAKAPLLTQADIDGIQAWVDYEETLYPDQANSNTFTQSTCP
jgi:hypothetical protein